jgi:hypothetical protein
VAAVVALLVVAGGLYWWLRRSPEPQQEQAAASAPAATPAPPAAVADDTPRYDLPPLETSDEFMRDRVAELSDNALVARWARGMGLVRNLAVVLDNTSRGLNPSQHLRVLRPAGTFRVIERGNRIVADPRNYERFTPIADAVSSIDPAAAARVYRGIKPLLQLGYDELGNQEPIDSALARAVRQILDAPVLDGEVPLQIAGEGVGYRYANAAHESRPGAQKQLMRMGPANQRRIQEQVRRFAEAAAIGQ